MSTLKTTNLQHASAASPAIVLASDGTATAQLSSLNGGALSGARNRIINGDMRIDQRNAGASVTPADDAYTLDRWNVGLTQSSKFSVQQSTTAPTGFANSLLVTSLSAYTVGSGDLFRVTHKIEGFNFSDLGWGAAGAQSVTLSFWVRSSLTGTFGGSLQNNAFNRSYPFSYAISAANTWEYKTVTISGDTTGTWVGSTNGIGLRLNFSLGTGSSSSGTAGAWASSGLVSTTGATSVVGTNGATFYITGVQLEAGSVATPFERRSYGQELALCQRYYFKSKADGSNAYLSNFGSTVDAVSARFSTALPVEMRANPTVGYSNVGIDRHTAAYSITGLAIFGSLAKNVVALSATGASGMTANQPVVLYSNSTSTGFIDYSAEL